MAEFESYDHARRVLDHLRNGRELTAWGAALREGFSRIEGHTPFALRFPNLKGYRINVAIDEYQASEGELPYDGTAELWWDSLEEMQSAFDSDAAAAAVADVSEFVAIQDLIVTRETVLLDSGTRGGIVPLRACVQICRRPDSMPIKRARSRSRRGRVPAGPPRPQVRASPRRCCVRDVGFDGCTRHTR
jgi:uncharacterized protein (TIGR02118 family)